MALIEMNMAYHFPIIYWNCACLTINASANEDVEDNKSTNYGKIAKAIGDMQHHGVKIALPDINTAKFGFAPDQKNNQIIFGLKGINAVGDDIVQQIIHNRPYSSMEDFFEKNDIGSIDSRCMINLVKAGCFDALESDRANAMSKYIMALTKIKIPKRTTGLTMANLDKATQLGIIPEKYSFEIRLVNFRKYIFRNEFKVNKGLYQLDGYSKTFFDNYLVGRIEEGREYIYNSNGVAIVKSKFEKWFKDIIQPLKDVLASPECINAFNRASYLAFANEVWNKYCKGTLSKWEMDSLSFYYHDHELTYVNADKYDLTDYEKIPENPVVIGTEAKSKKDKTITWVKYKLFKIVGTVLDKNPNKNYITLLTTTGVVTVKFYSGQFTNYDKQLSTKGVDGKKVVIEKSWFQRGNKLLITGIRRGDTFIPKRYFDSVYQHTVCLIEEILPNGDLKLKFEREKI